MQDTARYIRSVKQYDKNYMKRANHVNARWFV